MVSMGRTTTIFGAFCAALSLSLLAACGGGGGSSPPLPGGGGGGGNPSSSPGQTATPGGTPTPRATGSAQPTQTPPPTPTPQATNTPPPTPTPSPLPTATPTPNHTLTVGTGDGQINGIDNTFGGVGEEAGDGDYPSGGQGPTGSTFGPAQIPCLKDMWNQLPYHVHAFVGMYYNGSEIGLPDGVGMADPRADMTFQGIPNWTNYTYDPNNKSLPGCFYQMHTHDPSGTVHIEAQPPNGLTQYGTLYTLGDFLGLWGVPYTQNSIGPYNGMITVYWSGNVPRGGPGTSGEVGSNYYMLYNGDWTQIPLYSHQVIWIDIGPGNPVGSSLPNVAFWDEW